MSASRQAQRDFIIEWCGSHLGFDALSTPFHEAFWHKFGGSRKLTCWGAQLVPKAMTLAAEMEREGKLERAQVALGGAWQPGFPRHVYSYRLPGRMNQNPTDPVKELIEAAHAFDEDCNRHGGVGMKKSVATANAAVVAIPSISAMVAREEAVREYIKELLDKWSVSSNGHGAAVGLQCADRLEQIFPKEETK